MVRTPPNTIPALVLSLLLPTFVMAGVPEGYILNVSPNCGHNVSASAALITVATDLPFATVTAYCSNNESYDFFSNDPVTFVLAVFYTEQSEECVFNQHNPTDLYSIHVMVTWGSAAEQVLTYGEQYVVTCTFDANGQSNSDAKESVEALVAPREIQTNMGQDSTSEFTLRLTDILGDDLVIPVDIGKLVKVVATSDGAGGEVGLRALSCDAIGTSTNKKYAILRAGCGDGMVIGKKAGFLTDGLTSISPYFPSFRLYNDDNVQLDCNFTLCQTNCDGSSCNTVPVKRSSEDTPSGWQRFISLSTGHIALVQNDSVVEHSLDLEPFPDSGDDKDLEPRVPFPVECIILTIVIVSTLIFVIVLGRSLLQMNKSLQEPIFTIM